MTDDSDNVGSEPRIINCACCEKKVVPKVSFRTMRVVILACPFCDSVLIIPEQKVETTNIRVDSNCEPPDQSNEHSEWLLQMQKMESIGRLAVGVAHDFNNLLEIIIGYSEFAIEGLREDDSVRNDILEIRKAGERAAALTRQLLAFSRKRAGMPKVTNLNDAIRGIECLLRRLIGENIDLVLALANDIGNTMADPALIEQMVINLSINAKDAMPNGGKLTIETANVELDQEYVRRHAGMSAGCYVMLAVGDTGCGMDDETKAQIFEPFFTTKEPAKGTGLGLANVHSVVEQIGGKILVYSELGIGTNFKIYLPRERAVTNVDSQAPPTAVPAVCGETILVVEDEGVVCSVVKRILSGAGYTVLSASNGSEALLVCEKHKEPVHLVLTDVIMPKMSGPELVERLRAFQPELKVLYMSGYTDNAIAQYRVLERGTPFIAKPFNAKDLKRKVRKVLDKE